MEKNQIKTNIRLGSVVKEKDVEMEDNTKEGRTRIMRKDTVGCVQAVVWKKKLLVQL